MNNHSIIDEKHTPKEPSSHEMITTNHEQFKAPSFNNQASYGSCGDKIENVEKDCLINYNASNYNLPHPLP